MTRATRNSRKHCVSARPATAVGAAENEEYLRNKEGLKKVTATAPRRSMPLQDEHGQRLRISSRMVLWTVAKRG